MATLHYCDTCAKPVNEAHNLSRREHSSERAAVGRASQTYFVCSDCDREIKREIDAAKNKIIAELLERHQSALLRIKDAARLNRNREG